MRIVVSLLAAVCFLAAAGPAQLALLRRLLRPRGCLLGRSIKPGLIHISNSEIPQSQRRATGIAHLILCRNSLPQARLRSKAECHFGSKKCQARF
jgi:hypothetical protein